LYEDSNKSGAARDIIFTFYGWPHNLFLAKTNANLTRTICNTLEITHYDILLKHFFLLKRKR